MACWTVWPLKHLTGSDCLGEQLTPHTSVVYLTTLDHTYNLLGEESFVEALRRVVCMSICSVGFAEWQVEEICVLGGAGKCQSSEMPIHASLIVELRTHLPQANPTVLASSTQTANASTSRPAHRCRVAAGLVCK